MTRDHRSSTRAVVPAIACAALFFLQGCQAAMSVPAFLSEVLAEVRAAGSGTGMQVEWPLRFRYHSFDVRCFDTYGCRVVYAGVLQTDQDPDVPSPSSDSLGPDYREHWMGGHIGIRNFPPPAKVSWRSKDGVAHEALVDIGAIFRDGLVRHNVPREDMLEGSTSTDPGIFLEVNDRTLNVYMRAMVPTRTLQIPGNRHSDVRNDLILVHTKTY